MNPTPNPPAESGFDVIDPSAVLPIDCSPGFFQRMQQVAAFLTEGHTKLEIEAAHRDIQSKSVKRDTWVYQYETVVSFLVQYMKQVREAGKVNRLTPEEFQRLQDQQGT